jgi:SAM-dependent methyltransferase
MNRERGLTGVNSYERDLNFDIRAFLRTRIEASSVAWLDLCCGTGRALIEAVGELAKSNLMDRALSEGVDLAGHFDPNPFPMLTLQIKTAEAWAPTEAYTLITCVHGLHYVGDKLAVIAKAANSLTHDGLLLANLDLTNFRFHDGRPAGRCVAARLRRAGFAYDSRRRLLRCEGRRRLESGLEYLGADDAAGPNHTRQPAVDSYYTASN